MSARAPAVRPCVFWQRGTCRKGAACLFPHPAEQMSLSDITNFDGDSFATFWECKHCTFRHDHETPVTNVCKMCGNRRGTGPDLPSPQSFVTSVSSTNSRPYAPNYCQNMTKLLNDEDGFADVEFEFGPISVPAHRNVLAARSIKLKQILAEMRKENPTQKKFSIPITNTSYPIFLIVLRFIYLGDLPLFHEMEETIDILKAADEFQLNNLKAACISYLCGSCLNEKSALDLLILSCEHDAPNLENACTEYIVEHMDSIYDRSKFLSLPKEALMALLAHATDLTVKEFAPPVVPDAPLLDWRLANSWGY